MSYRLIIYISCSFNIEDKQCMPKIFFESNYFEVWVKKSCSEKAKIYENHTYFEFFGAEIISFFHELIVK